MASRSFQIDNKRQRSLSDNFSAYVNYPLCLFESIAIKPVMRVYNSSNVTTVWYDFDIETLTEEDAGVYVDRVIQMAEANGAEIQIW